MRQKILMDVIFYLGIPMATWNFCRELWGDYLTILFGMLPAVIYTIVSFILHKEWNVTGVFFLSLISLNFLMNLLSHTALQELWNGVWMSCICTTFYVITILIRRPIGLYLFIDYSHARGVPREKSKALFCTPKHFHHFVRFTLFLCLRELVVIIVKSSMIIKMGVEGFDSIQLFSTILNYAFTALMVYYIVYIVKQIAKDKTEPASGDKGEVSNVSA